MAKSRTGTAKSSAKKVKTAAYVDSLTGDGNIAATFGHRVEWWPLSKSSLSKTEILKSDRSDYGRVIDIRIPEGYHAQVKKSWEMYDTDRLFRYLVDRCIDFGANGAEWEVPLQIDIKKVNTAAKAQKIEEKDKLFWDTWASSINDRVANVMPGLDEINKWIIKHLLLGAMAPLQWEWGKINVNKKEYEVPVRMTITNPLSIALDRKTDAFTDEDIFLKVSNRDKIKEGYKENIVSLYTDPTRDRSYIKLDAMGVKDKSRREIFCIKYNWSPGDNTALVYGRNVHVGQGLYPTPPFVGLFETLVVRRALQAADIAILDGIIHYIIDWEIGDNTVVDGPGGRQIMPNQPRPAKKDSSGAKIEKSSIEMAKDIITSDTRGPVMQIFHPYYYKLNIRMPDVTTLISAEKYVQTTLDIYQAFGILISPPTTRTNLEDINVLNFEELLENIRQRHIKRFWESLCKQIVHRNKGKLSSIPNYIFNPLNTKSNDFKQSVYALAKIGKVSSDTLLQTHSLNKKVEMARIAREILTGEKAMYDNNTPVSFVQSVVNNPKGASNGPSNRKEMAGEGSERDDEAEETTVAISANTQTGRPRGARDKGKRETKRARR